MGNLEFFAAFMKVVGHLRANNYPIYGIESTGATINSMKLSTLTITPKFHTNTANYITVQFNLDTDPQNPGTKGVVDLLDSNNITVHTTTFDMTDRLNAGKSTDYYGVD